ncbi:hypothetical protein, partial [Prevotella sp. F0091]|uniref:hypothetical protein n=1 Tax=Prevotella sp. F0091 TaxID=1227276 RepID=UPI0025EA362F
HLLFILSIPTFCSQFIPCHPYIIVKLTLRTICANPPHHMCRVTAPHVQSIRTTANDGKHSQTLYELRP